MISLVAVSVVLLTASPADERGRCRALTALGFQRSEWKCLHAPAEEKNRVAVLSRYRLAPGVELVCAGPRKHRCTELAALRDGERVPLFVPELPAPISEYRLFPGEPLRMSATQQLDCRGAQGALMSCPQESAVGRVEVTSRGVEVVSDTWKTAELPAPPKRTPTEAPLRFVHARSVGDAKGQVLWRGDTLCLKGTSTRCYDSTSERWTRGAGELTEGTTIGDVDGRAPHFEPDVRAECSGFRQLTIEGHRYDVRDLDVDGMLPTPEDEYPTRGITRLVLSPSGRAGVLSVPRFARLPTTVGDAVPCGDNNFNDWHVVAYELFFFENPSARGE